MCPPLIGAWAKSLFSRNCGGREDERERKREGERAPHPRTMHQDLTALHELYFFFGKLLNPCSQVRKVQFAVATPSMCVRICVGICMCMYMYMYTHMYTCM